MVAFKNFLLATSLILGWVAACPIPEAGLNVFDKRALVRGASAAQVCENEYVQSSLIQDDDGYATVVDLTGCTAIFFYEGDVELTAAYHIFCGNEPTDGVTAAQWEPEANYATIVAADDGHYQDAKNAIMSVNPSIEIGPAVLYSAENLNGASYWALGRKDSHEVSTIAVANKVCDESDPS